MKKYLISMEGNYGYPDGDFNNHCVVEEIDLKKTIRDYLMPYLENWIQEGEIENELIDKIKLDRNFYFNNLGYGEELFIKVEEV